MKVCRLWNEVPKANDRWLREWDFLIERLQQ